MTKAYIVYSTCKRTLSWNKNFKLDEVEWMLWNSHRTNSYICSTDALNVVLHQLLIDVFIRKVPASSAIRIKELGVRI